VARGYTLVRLVVSVFCGLVVDKVWDSINTKVWGQYLASMNMAQDCEVCGETLTPVDVGVDPDTDERLWLTHCCGVTNRFLEKLEPH